MFCNNIKYTLGLFQCRLPIPQFSGSNFIRSKKIFLKTLVTHLHSTGQERRHERQEGENETKVGKEVKEGEEGGEEND